MFATWSMARRASLTVAAAAAAVVLSCPPARALEGIQGRHAIFYPSLELVYQHDDNLFLSPTNEISADSFIAHAHFRLEVPGARQHLTLEYQPQYRSIDVGRGASVDLPDNLQHFWDLKAKLRGSSIFSVDIKQHASLAILETQDLDQNRGELLRNTSQFLYHDIGTDFHWDGSRQGATISLGKTDSDFDDFQNAPVWFEMNDWRFGAQYHYRFTPLSRFLVGYNHSSSTQDFTPGFFADKVTNIPNGLPKSVDSDTNEVYFGFDGELGRTTTGNARIGFKSLDYASDQTFPVFPRPTPLRYLDNDWDGITAKANITKSFSRYSKLIFGLDRNVNSSIFAGDGGADNNYYVSNRAAFTFTNQPQGSRVFWTLVGAFQRNTYDVASADSSGRTLDRRDDLTHLRAEVGYHPLEHVSVRLNYRYERRDSTHNRFDYVDNLVILQVQFGF